MALRLPTLTRSPLWLWHTAAALVTVLASSPVAAHPPATTTRIAAHPPMGWNSYDAYGTTITEAQFRANVRWMSRHLARYGWHYAVIDAEWFVRNPTPTGNSHASLLVLDPYGRYVPAPNRFPSAAGGVGFKPLADYVHSLGLKFGIHILRGIPREAVARNLPIEGSPHTAAQAADVHAACPWNADNYGVDPDRPAGQAYYDSIARLYASWGVDFIKADCIANHPYSAAEIRMLSAALRGSGRDMVLSLSPGPAPIVKLPQLRRQANMWRISNDIWDLWHSSNPYPQGVGDQFARSARWAPLAGPGGWPDADMLALGALRPAPGWGKPRHSQLTRAEQRTYMTLWCIARSPLFLGANLTEMDPWTMSLLDNPEVIAVDQRSADAHQLLSDGGTVAWVSRPEGTRTNNDWYVAVFNLQARKRTITLPWTSLSFTGQRYAIRDLWNRRDLGPAEMLRAQLPAHGAALYRLSRP
ncbi:MAG TPA: glycoside hydrolase family 27 protein [Steroidobacteraceae bacterium]|nr:glycoside hydrolase family 27 protein [Steroidobacteraceae bacterium]